MLRSFPLPHNLFVAARRQGREAWLGTLPATVGALAERWSLVVEEPFEPGGQTAWVAPARHASGGERVLKVVWPHPETAHEADALALWRGDGAVLLYESAELDGALALLLERCVPGTTLAHSPEPEQDVVLAGLLRRLWRDPPPGSLMRSLQEMSDAWADEFEQHQREGLVDLDPGLARDGIALFRTLPATAARNVVLCTDLHAENVLAAQREPWLVIDPNPYVGDPTYDVLQHMLDCDERLRADPRGLAYRMADLLDLDRDRLLLWLFARCVQESPGWPGLADVARAVAPV